MAIRKRYQDRSLFRQNGKEGVVCCCYDCLLIPARIGLNGQIERLFMSLLDLGKSKLVALMPLFIA